MFAYFLTFFCILLLLTQKLHIIIIILTQKIDITIIMTHKKEHDLRISLSNKMYS